MASSNRGAPAAEGAAIELRKAEHPRIAVTGDTRDWIAQLGYDRRARAAK